MKITDVRAIPLFVPLEQSVGAPIALPYADQLASVVFGGYRATIVQVLTDEGLIGIGGALAVALATNCQLCGLLKREMGWPAGVRKGGVPVPVSKPSLISSGRCSNSG